MIIVEYYKTRKDGVVLNRTYSDAGMMIEREGVRYSEAIDPAELGRTYTETAEAIGGEDEDAAGEDYLSALASLVVSE